MRNNPKMARTIAKSLAIGGVAAFAFVFIPRINAAEQPIVIGATVSETGAFAVEAAYHLKGEELAVDDANANGGWLGQRVELKHYDDKSDPGTAARLYEQLVTKDNVTFLIGPYSSAITQAVIPTIDKYGMATIQPRAPLPDIFTVGNKWSFQGVPPSTDYLQDLLPLAKSRGARLVAILAAKSANASACGRARTAQANLLGMEVVYETTYTLPQPDFSSIALAVKNAHPDVVIACASFSDSVGIAQALHHEQFVPEFFAETIGPLEAEFPKALGSLANGIITDTSWWPTLPTPGNRGFVERYRAMYNQEPDYHAASAYAAVQVLGAAVTATNSTDQARIRNWLVSHEVQTVQGTFKVNGDGLAIGFGQYLVQVQDGRQKLIWPSDIAQARPIIPYPGS